MSSGFDSTDSTKALADLQGSWLMVLMSGRVHCLMAIC